MRVKLKIALSAILWTACITTAVADTMFTTDRLLVWALVLAAAAAVVSAMLAGDYIAAEAGKQITEQSVAKITRAIEKSGRARDDHVVSRVKALNDAAVRRVALEVAEAIAGDKPTPIR